MNLVIYSERLPPAPFDESGVDLAIEKFADPDVLKFARSVVEEDKIRIEISHWILRGSTSCIGIWCISDRGSGDKIGSVALLPMPIEEDST